MAIATVEWQPTPAFVLLTSLGMYAFDNLEPLLVVTNDTSLPELTDEDEPDVGSGIIRGFRIASVTVMAIHTMLPMNIIAKIFGLNEKPLMRLVPECRLRVAHGTTVGLGCELRSGVRRHGQRLLGGGVSANLVGSALLPQHNRVRTKPQPAS
jgi:hypothetical protein